MHVAFFGFFSLHFYEMGFNFFAEILQTPSVTKHENFFIQLMIFIQKLFKDHDYRAKQSKMQIFTLASLNSESELRIEFNLENITIAQNILTIMLSPIFPRKFDFIILN